MTLQTYSKEEIDRLVDALTKTRELLIEANDILRSVSSIADRKGADTNWHAFEKRVKSALKRQHKHLKEFSCAP